MQKNIQRFSFAIDIKVQKIGSQYNLALTDKLSVKNNILINISQLHCGLYVMKQKHLPLFFSNNLVNQMKLFTQVKLP